ncbi:hypothetical protein [Microvirga rosea]|uniref:hypothetical protein n=1 Tax=Microvirga rosea TaxID=2715425 RepID=UPI001D0B51FF|nr:hypothetical protein [Microvirga rosea]MCB8823206.1 hypothetical protein [Microvirga rosea]
MSFKWLTDNVRGFAALSADEHSAIMEFGLIWSVFEARILGTNASAARIQACVHAWNRSGTLDARAYADELAYFRDRYFHNGSLTEHFNNLCLRSNDNARLVETVIRGRTNAPDDCVTAVLIIVYRFRNNLFHGLKWQHRLAGQLENFKNANSAMIKTLERHGRLDQDE